MKLKIDTEKCILCGACTVVEESKIVIDNGKIIPKGDYTEEVANEIISVCPVEAIEK